MIWLRKLWADTKFIGKMVWHFVVAPLYLLFNPTINIAASVVAHILQQPTPGAAQELRVTADRRARRVALLRETEEKRRRVNRVRDQLVEAANTPPAEEVKEIAWLTPEELKKFDEVNKDLPKDQQERNKELLDRYKSYLDQCPISLTPLPEIKCPITIECNFQGKLSINTFECDRKADNNFYTYIESCVNQNKVPFNPVTRQPLDSPDTKVYRGFSKTIIQILKYIRADILSKWSNASKHEDKKEHPRRVLPVPIADSSVLDHSSVATQGFFAGHVELHGNELTPTPAPINSLIRPPSINVTFVQGKRG